MNATLTSYFESVPVTEKEAAKYEQIAVAQEARIYALMKDNASFEGWTSELLHSCKVFQNTPLTSIRRALSNLENAGKIRKTGQQQGQYNRPIFRYGVVC